ncbi:carbohydrate-binding protein [Aquimarina rubra]|uniref:Carbohydrate-binding protein n=1 Tax=Aquimarina rubra TaxID=1920033 RepID=A0ABW5LKV0_9FLAO
MKTKNHTLTHVLLTSLLFFITVINAQITINCDYTIEENAKQNIPYQLDVFNRIHPANGFRMPSTPNSKLCIVRPLGGIARNNQPEFFKDSYRWNGTQFVTDFSRLKTQIDGIFDKGVGLHQIVLDNPSWDFQRNADGTLPGNEYKVSTYGNAEPPRDFNAWANYLKEVMRFLINTYGREEMLKVQFGIGREIGTSGHWTGTQQRFFQFYRRSVRAIHSVLPDAKVGSHFLWESSNFPWGTDFVKWCKANNVHYDFVGVSFYPFFNQSGRIDLDEVYAKDFGAIKDIPQWNSNAKLEIHEFALLETLNGQGNGYTEASTAHQNAFMVALMKMFFEHDMVNLFQWGPGDNYSPANAEFSKLKGNTYYKSSKSGNQNSNNNYVNGLFTYDPENQQYNIMAYNHSHRPNSNVAEQLNFKATFDTPVGSSVRYRLAIYNKANGTLPWSDWMTTTTTNATNNKSTINLSTTLPAFSFLKYEVIVDGSVISSAPEVRIDSPTENQVFREGYDELLVRTFIADPDGDLLSAELFIDNISINVRNTRPYTWGEDNEILGLTKGQHTLKVIAVDRTGNTAQDEVVITVRGEQEPLIDSPWPVPGVIEAENYDIGGEGIAYSDTDAQNLGNAYRVNEGVDIGNIAGETGRHLGWTKDGEWLEYSVNIAEEAYYNFNFRYSTIHDGTAIGAELADLNQVLFTNGTFGNTKSWNTYENKTRYRVKLPRGQHILRLNILKGRFNIDKLSIERSFNQNDRSNKPVESLTLHPNPSKTGVVYLNRSLVWNVYTINGQLISKGTGDMIDLSNIIGGIYILKTNEGIVKKIVLE